MRLDIRPLATALLFASLLARPTEAQDASAPVRTSADSSYTDAQAERGAQLFTRVCLECHERVDLSNADFRLKWGGQTTFDLFKNISTTMPDNNPGMLAKTEYADVVAYILKLNGVPAGPAELVADSTVLSQAKMTLPGATGAGNFSAIRRHGVLARAGLVSVSRGRPAR